MLACRPVKKPLNTMVFGTLWAVAVAASTLAAAQETSAGTETPSGLVDRIVAVVDEDPIRASDLDRAIGLGLVPKQAGEDETVLRRRALDLLLEERLRAHEVDRFGFTEVSLTEVEEAVGALRSAFGSEQAFMGRLAELGLTIDDVRQIAARQIMVLTYVDERLGPRVFVSLDDIRAYYDSVLTPEMARTNAALPPLADVREQIRRVLREERLNQEIERWTRELRLEADIEDYFEPADEASGDVSIGVRTAPDSGP